MRTKHKSTVLLFSCPMGYSNMYWFESAISLPKKQSHFYQRLPNISQSCQTKLNTHTHTLSLSLSFGGAAMASLLGAISHSSSHVALAHNTKPKKIHQLQCRTLPLPHQSPICRYTSLFLHYFFPLASRQSWRNQYINLSLFFLTSLFLLALISGFLSVELSLFRCFATVARI